MSSSGGSPPRQSSRHRGHPSWNLNVWPDEERRHQPRLVPLGQAIPPNMIRAAGGFVGNDARRRGCKTVEKAKQLEAPTKSYFAFRVQPRPSARRPLQSNPQNCNALYHNVHPSPSVRTVAAAFGEKAVLLIFRIGHSKPLHLVLGADPLADQLGRFLGNCDCCGICIG